VSPEAAKRSRYAPIPEPLLEVARSARVQVSRLSAGSRLEPSYLIIGTQKGGTSSLQSYLGEHPSVSIPRLKEVNYFNRNYERRYSWYRAQFPRRPASGADEPVTGEATPEYLFDPRVPKRVAERLPHVKLMVLLRNPATRALSHYHHEVARGNESLSFREALEAEPGRTRSDAERIRRDPDFKSDALRHYTYAARGMYAEQLERWFERFSRDRVLVLQSEKFFAQPDAVYQRVLEALNLTPYSPQTFRVYNSRAYAALSDDDRRFLEEKFVEPNERLFELLGERYDWEA